MFHVKHALFAGSLCIRGDCNCALLAGKSLDKEIGMRYNKCSKERWYEQMALGKDTVRFLIVRHGESLGNATQTFLGHSDADLSELGYAQARATCDYIIHHYKIDEVRSSDLKRARNTVAEVAAHFEVPLTLEVGLREIMIGKWEMMRISDIDEQYHDDFLIWKTNFGICCPTGGESAAHLRARIAEEMWRIAKENLRLSQDKTEGRTVCIGCHAAAIRMLISEIRGVTLEDVKDIPWAPNASVTELMYHADGTVEEVAYGNNAFMPEKLYVKIGADGTTKKN